MQYPLVSVIIPTYNSAATLRRCLSSIKLQTYPNIELIIVDKLSSDMTLEIAKGFGAYIYTKDFKERSEQINHGVKKSKGKYIYRVDSDLILDPHLIEEAVRKCELENFDAISVFNSPDPTISFWAKVRKLEKDCYKGDLNRCGARFFRKDVFEAIGGFNENLIAGEDYDIYNRLSKTEFKIGILEPEELHIGEPKSVLNIISKQYYYGKKINLFFKENKLAGVVQVLPFRKTLFLNWRKFIKHPYQLIGFIFYEFIVYGSTAAGYLSNMINEYILERINNSKAKR